MHLTFISVADVHSIPTLYSTETDLLINSVTHPTFIVLTRHLVMMHSTIQWVFTIHTDITHMASILTEDSVMYKVTMVTLHTTQEQ